VPKAIWAVPLCRAPTLRRGQRPHHAQKEQNGTWEISRLTGRPSGCPARVGFEVVIEPGDRVAIGGRRQDSPTWLRAGQGVGETPRGRKLVVQMVQTRQPNGAPSFVERLDAFDLAASAGIAPPPVMIYGDDVTHVITERGVPNLLRCRSPQEGEAALLRGCWRHRFRQEAIAGSGRQPAPPWHLGVSC
jgi:hypothetical protein